MPPKDASLLPRRREKPRFNRFFSARLTAVAALAGGLCLTFAGASPAVCDPAPAPARALLVHFASRLLSDWSDRVRTASEDPRATATAAPGSALARFQLQVSDTELSRKRLEGALGEDAGTNAADVEALAQEFERQAHRSEMLYGALPGGSNSPKPTGKSASLLELASHGSLEELQAAVAGGADVNAAGDRGVTALMAAAAAGRVDAVEYLIMQHADVNVRDARGETALMSAASCNAIASGKQILRLLLDAHANVNARNDAGGTALRRAKLYRLDAYIEILRAEGAK